MKRGNRRVTRTFNKCDTQPHRKTPAQLSADAAKAAEHTSRSFDHKPSPSRHAGGGGLGPPLYDIQRGPLPVFVPRKT